jgi:hypothetical protein
LSVGLGFVGARRLTRWVFICITLVVTSRPVREGLSKGEEDGRRPPPNSHKAVWGVARPQGV